MVDVLFPSLFVPMSPLNADANPMTPSGDYRSMEPYWYMVETILAGTLAMRNAGQRYLPRFHNETVFDYELRRANAKFTNIYRDIVENLAAKPFSKEVKLKDNSASEAVKSLIEDIDGQGNHLHVFAGQVFFQAINDAVDWIFVDKQPVPDGATVATEKQMGVRPYWVHVPAKRMLAVHSDMVDGRQQVIHARIWEPVVVRQGYSEKEVNRVRELIRDKTGDGYGPARFILWEEVRPSPNLPGHVSWQVIDSGPIAIGVIALVPVITGRRQGSTWRFDPPMQDAAFLQIEHYQQESNLKYIKECAAFPMLTGNGVSPPMDDSGKPIPLSVGPRKVLYAPPAGDRGGGNWTYVEPSAQSMTFLASDIKATEQNLRELGRQPLTANTGNLTVVTTAFAAQKGNSAIQAWAFNLRDALEQALKFTCQWLGDTSEPEIYVYTDFSIDLENDAVPNFLLSLRDKRDISRKAIINEAKRRDYLSPEYDPDEDLKELENEGPADPTPQDIQDALPPQPGPNNPPAPRRLRIIPQGDR